jgi:hypothetical protein
MKQYLSLFFVIVFIACNNEPLKEKEAELPKISKLVQLDKNFKEISYDTFYVYSSDNTEDINYQFRGKPMDSVQVQALPAVMKELYKFSKDFSACYKFKISDSQTGFISRVPGEYVSSAVELFVFDIKKDSVTHQFFLADNFGDAGEVYNYRSCIFRNDKKKHMILSYFVTSYDHSVEGDTADTSTETWNKYILFEVAKNSIDTVSDDSSYIVKHHPEILKKLTGD